MVAVILSSSASSVYALPNVPWKFSFGGKGVTSSDNVNTNTYFKPFVTFGYDGTYAGFIAGYWRYINFMITDVAGNENLIGINKVSGEFSVNAVDNLILGLEFDYYNGEYNYNGYEFLFNIGYDFTKVSLYAQLDCSFLDYTMSNYTYKNHTYNLFAEAGYFLTGDISVEFDYSLMNLKSTGFDTDNFFHEFRIGLDFIFIKKVYLSCGLNAGIDTTDYALIGPDLGLNIYLWDHLKLTAMYKYTYNYYIMNTAYGYHDHMLSYGASFYL